MTVSFERIKNQDKVFINDNFKNWKLVAAAFRRSILDATAKVGKQARRQKFRTCSNRCPWQFSVLIVAKSH